MSIIYNFKGIGNTDSVLTLSELKSFIDTLPKERNFKIREDNNKKIKSFIEKNSPSVNAEDLRRGQKVWVFREGYVARGIIKEVRSSKSPKMITLFFKEDETYESWERENINFRSELYSLVLKAYDGGLYLSVKRDKKITLG